MNLKEKINSYLDSLSEEQLKTLVSEIENNADIILQLNKDIKRMRTALKSGSNEEWEKSIVNNENR